MSVLTMAVDNLFCCCSKDRSLSSADVAKRIYRTNGILGFYKGISASYFGVSETVIHFLIYETIKSKILADHVRPGVLEDRSTKDFVRFMGAAACSKTFASTLAYPHGLIPSQDICY